MPQLMMGVLTPYVALFAWGIWDGFPWLRYQRHDILGLAIVMLLIPACAAWAAAELIQCLTPRRFFDPRPRGGVRRFMLGLIAGVAGVGAGAAGLPLLDRFAPDALPLGGGSALAVAATMLLLSRRRAGHCVTCGYDLRGTPGPGQPGAGRCPECGTSALAACSALRG
jgi:hypothetical protein